MGNSDKPKGKPQQTGRFGKDDGDHLYTALDMGFASRFWARIRSEAIIQAFRSG